MKEQQDYHFVKNQIPLLIALSLIPGLVYIVFGWYHDKFIPALIWYFLIISVSLWGWRLYVRYEKHIMEPNELEAWYMELKAFNYSIFSLWTLVFILYAGESESKLHYIAIFTQLGTSVVASALLVVDKKLFVPILLVVLLPLAIYFVLIDTWYGYVLAVFTIIFLGVLLYASFNTYKLIQKNNYQAKHDMLTGLYNRRYFLTYIEDLLLRIQNSRKTAYLLLIDLDHFKTINDSLGHDVGDRVLETVAKRIENFTEETHIVSRFGGDEFTLVSIEHDDKEYSEEDAYAVAQALLLILKQPYMVDKHRLYLSASIGIKQIKHTTVDSHQFIKEADIAMYEAKSQGRDGVILFNESLSKRVERDLKIEQKLYFALEEKKIKLYYQPQFNANQVVVGAEALVRWKDDDTFVRPDLFIPIAEKIGLIVELGYYLLEEAFSTLKEWEEKGLFLEQFSINISVRQLLANTFVEDIEFLCNRYLTQSMRNKIYFEVTESILTEDVSSIVDTMNQLKVLGISFSLDDFGTGYSSLSNLHTMPIDELKIDKSFIGHLLEENVEKTMIPAIISLSKLLNIKVVAEGVETKIQFDFLVEMECDIYQGFYFNEAVDKDVFLTRYNS